MQTFEEHDILRGWSQKKGGYNWRTSSKCGSRKKNSILIKDKPHTLSTLQSPAYSPKGDCKKQVENSDTNIRQRQLGGLLYETSGGLQSVCEGFSLNIICLISMSHVSAASKIISAHLFYNNESLFPIRWSAWYYIWYIYTYAGRYAENGVDILVR